MDRARRIDEHRGLIRATLVALTAAGVRVLSGVARRLGQPALASVPVSAAVLTPLDTVRVEQPLDEVAQLLVAGRHTQLPILDGDQPVGVVTRADVAAAVQVLGPHAPVSDAHRHEVVTVSPSDSLVDVLRRLRAAPDTVVVVVDRGAPVGMITFERLLAYAEQAATPTATG